MTLSRQNEGISRLERNGRASPVPASTTELAASGLDQLRWVFLHDPQKEPDVTGWCPGSGGVLMAFSLTSQQCRWWGGVSTFPGEGLCG